jgi:hypothetical protein
VSGDGLRHGSWRCGVGAGLVALALAGLTAPAATQAGGDDGTDLGTAGGLNYRVNISPDFVGASFDSFVSCLDGSRPVAGGIDLEGSATTSRMGSTYPAKEGDLRMWRSAGHNLGAGSMDMSFFAVCREVQPRLSTFRRADRPFPVDKRRTVRAACPDGFRVTGGGVHAVNPLVSASAPYDGRDADAHPDDGWKATAKNLFPQPDELTAFASCRKAGTWDLEYVKGQSTVSGGLVVDGDIPCLDGAVTGGGASITGPSGLVRLHETYPSDAGDLNEVPADAWFASVRNGAMSTVPAVLYAICKT